ncbi:MFS transporter [Rhodococcus wratislaviensis]|uniref:Putative proline/betaine transporter n=1 Tax=Rhodococcus wratislaviensis NBRC 100605 TaxID=1219028 RepID=X0Q9A9_RHOWR|nr:MFS transporter [Rhodococcus wratislaviensis]GAF48157.1 putative major facilitator superfamily transporter [Rhodococcus wratislaviensis NBRC 100605]
MTESISAAPTAGPASARKRKDATRAGVSAFVGTTLEWFDFYIYGSAAALVFGDVFFSGAPSAVGTLAAFGTFWVGFLARPLGGLIFGHFGDRYGRKSALVITLAMMGVSTVAIGLLPSYATIGVLAPILLVVLRMVQGVAVGGEWGGAVLIATEYAPPGKRLLYGAFAQQGSPVGNLLATLAFLGVAQLPDDDFTSWGWRLPFLASALLMFVGLFIRLQLAETPDMTRLLEQNRKKALPAKVVLTKYRTLVALGTCAAVAGVALTYVKSTFVLSWATEGDNPLFDRSTFLTILAVALAVQVIGQPFGAVIAQRMNLRRAVYWMLLPELVAIPVMFVLVQTGSLWWAMIGMAVATLPHAMYYAILAGILASVFPTEVRYTGISLSYQLCATVFSGTAPFFCQLLLATTGSVWSVVALAMGYVVLTLTAIVPLLRRMGENATNH